MPTASSIKKKKKKLDVAVIIWSPRLQQTTKLC